VPGAGNSQAWNRYSYVLNRPTISADPSGHMTCNVMVSGSRPVDEDACENAQRNRDPDYVGPLDYQRPGQPVHVHRTVTQSDERAGEPTVFDKAIQGDITAVIDLLIPTHVGVRVQVEGSFDPGVSTSGTAGFNLVYNRVSDELAYSIDVAGTGGVGVGTGGSVTGGVLIGWASSDVDDATTGTSGVLSATGAYIAAVTASISAPLKVDPKYGQVPFTFYVGAGSGGAFADAGIGPNLTITHGYLTNLLPWYGSNWK
jgi:hypothetical protein